MITPLHTISCITTLLNGSLKTPCNNQADKAICHPYRHGLSDELLCRVLLLQLRKIINCKDENIDLKCEAQVLSYSPSK